MTKQVKIITVFCATVLVLIISIAILTRPEIVHEDATVDNEYFLFIEGKREITLIHASEDALYFSAVNESYLYNLYVINYSDNETTVLDYNIFQGVQYDNGYIYYTKLLYNRSSRSFGSRSSRSFRRVGVVDGSREDVVAVEEVYVKGELRTLNNAYFANGNYYTSMWNYDLCGNATNVFIIGVDPSNEARIISDYMFSPRGLTWYENKLYFSGTNLNEDGIYVVPDEGGMRRRLRTGPTTILTVSGDRIFFTTERFHYAVTDINYILLNGCQETNLFTGESANIEVMKEWVYFIDIEDSAKIKRVNVYSGEIQTLTDGRVKDFILSDSGEWLLYQRTFLAGSHILKLQIPCSELADDAENPFVQSSVEQVTENLMNGSASEDDWKNLYLDYINRIFENYAFMNFEWIEFILVHISDDDVPELIINFGSTASGQELLTISNGQLEISHLPASGISFIERENLFVISGGRMGFFFDEVCRIQDGKLDILYEGASIMHISEEDSVDFQFYWNEKEVSEKKYHQLLTSVFDDSRAVWAHENAYSMCEIIDIIRMYPHS